MGDWAAATRTLDPCQPLRYNPGAERNRRQLSGITSHGLLSQTAPSPRERVLAARITKSRTECRSISGDIGLRGLRRSHIEAAKRSASRRPIRVYDPVQQLAMIDEDVLERFGVDTIEIGRGFALEDGHWRGWTLPDGSPCQMPVGMTPDGRRGSGYCVVKRPCSGSHARWCLVFRTMLLALSGKRRLGSAQDGRDENMWWAAQSPPGPLASGTGGPAVLAEGARRLRHRLTVRSSACSEATCWKPASFSTARTPSSCCWPANRPVPMTFSTAYRVTWRICNDSCHWSALPSTSCFSATTWGCRADRSCPRRCTASFSSRATHGYGRRRGAGQCQSHAPLLRRRAETAR